MEVVELAAGKSNMFLEFIIGLIIPSLLTKTFLKQFLINI
jgi:tetrahydromethanopterin S-methyltransferase subunit B